MTPNLFLIAAPRSGSTQLAHWLASHPDIDLCPIKEPTHFAQADFPPGYVQAMHLDDVDPVRFLGHRHRRPAQFAVVRDRRTYEALFDQLQARWRCDASTAYLANPQAPLAIAAAYPEARVITLTRDPLERALSHYRLARRTGRTVCTLAEELDREHTGMDPPGARYLIRPSMQTDGVNRIAATFGPDRHLALRFEEMIADPPATLGRIAAFLGLDPAGFDLGAAARNPGIEPRFPRLNRWLLANGMKTGLRRVLPDAVKRALKPIWFDATREPTISPDERAALATAIEAAEVAAAREAA